MTTHRLIVLLVSFLAASLAALAAEPTKLTRLQASELFVALSTAEAGFAPGNTIAAADNLNALRPHVEAFDKGKLAYQRAIRALAKAQPADLEAQATALGDDLEAKGAELIAVELVPLALTDEEIAASKIRPASLAVLRQWLRAAPKK